MSSAIGKIIFLLSCLIFVAVIACACMASFGTIQHGSVWYDGLGRKLVPTPFLVRFIFGEDRFWTGWSWLFGDIVWFFGGLALSVKMAWMGINI